MVTLLLHLLRLLPILCGGHRQVALENLALRHQLAVYKKMVNRPKLLSGDRLFWVALSRVWAGWRQALVIVSPNTVLRWQRRRFCEHWTKLSARPIAGRPPVSAEIKALVKRMAADLGSACGWQDPRADDAEEHLALCKVYGRIIGYPELKPHDLRHGVAMEVLEQHHDLEQVRALLGHARLDTTQIYTSIRPAQLKRAVSFYEEKAIRMLGEGG